VSDLKANPASTLYIVALHPQDEIAPPSASELDDRHVGIANGTLVVHAAQAIFYRK
jgi:hypothetical protein